MLKGAGVIGSFFTIPAIPTWYQTLNKPGFSPPNWVFGPVWTTLYFLMGLALYLIWQKKKGWTIFAIQLALNVLWSAVFFGAHSIFGGLVVIVCLWLTILATIASFWKISRPALEC